jgi:hypothetical protein
MAIPNSALIRRAQDSREPLLTGADVSVLFDQACAAMRAGRYQESFAAVEALLCQADREGGLRPAGLLPDPARCPIAEGRTGAQLEMVRGFIDRVEALNSRAERGWRSAATRP